MVGAERAAGGRLGAATPVRPRRQPESPPLRPRWVLRSGRSAPGRGACGPRARPCSAGAAPGAGRPSAWLLSAALQWGFTCGTIQTRWITVYHSASNWSSRKFCGCAGSQLSLVSCASQSGDFLTLKCGVTAALPTRALRLGLCARLDGGLL